MVTFHRILRTAAYIPLRPCNIKAMINLLRFAHLLPQTVRPNHKHFSILVIQPHNSLGDLVLSIPFLEEAHRLWPEAYIDVIVGNAMTDLFANIPFIRRVFGFSPSTNAPPLSRYENTLRLLKLYLQQIDEQYDIAIDPRWDSDGYAYLARSMSFVLGAPIRMSYSGLVDGFDPTLDQFMTHLATNGRNEHELVRKLRLLGRSGFASRAIEENEIFDVSTTLITMAKLGESDTKSLLQKASIHPGEKYAILAPSASTAAKIWPVEYMVRTAQILYSEYGFRFLVIGSSKDLEICGRIVSEAPGIAISLAGKTDVIELLALIRQAEIFIGNDSGPAHLSGMVGIPTVVTIVRRAPSEVLDRVDAPRRFRPCGPLVRLVHPDRPLSPCNEICNFDSAHCITQISSEAVLTASRELLSASNVGHHPTDALRRTLLDH